ncbi:prepilin-type N-terminal cleavage/methylation domain-containing protein [Candidatus Gracilibacteria bacterium]|nr:prepilin-type N-terminal cleavage/methylation domain-containing protein [Candidatus Gracilibacteria bacterium]
MQKLIKKFFQKKASSQRKNGFTLVEVLVSIVISGMVLVSVMGSYWILMKTNQAAELSRNLQKETSFTLIRMTDKIRSLSIDYEAYENNSGKLCENQNLQTEQIMLCIKDNQIFEHKDGMLFMNDQPLFSSSFEVETVYFSVSPSQDPFKNLAKKEFQLQPKVTIFLKVKAKLNPKIKFEIQTTISSRKYTP